MASILDGVTTNTILEVAVIGGGWIATFVRFDGRLKSMEEKISAMELKINEVTSLSRWRERMEERSLTLRRDLDELRHGRGFIREEVNGEYDEYGHRKESP